MCFQDTENVFKDIVVNKLKIVDHIYLFKLESSICEQNTLERLDPQFTKYQFKLNVKQLMCGI